MTLLSEYLAELNARVDRERDALANGAAHTLEEYTKRVGIIAGLRQAGQILQDLVKNKPREERDI